MRHVGIDIGSKTLAAVYQDGKKMSECREFDNTDSGHRQLIKWIKKGKQKVQACLEATGVYHFNCAVALYKSETIDVMVLNPRVSKNFAMTMDVKTKNDSEDAKMLSEFPKRMDFIPWEAPSNEIMAIRSYARKLANFGNMMTQMTNQLHALKASDCAILSVIEAQKKVMNVINEQTEALKKEADKFIKKHPSLNEKYQRIQTIKGFGKLSALQVLAEVVILPEGLTAKQWVAHAGLNPVEHTSGTSVQKKSRISKAGNRYLRRALYMPAQVASNSDEYVKGYYWHVIQDRGLKHQQALCAIMRKHLHMIHKMLETQTDYDASRFYKHPISKETGKEYSDARKLKHAKGEKAHKTSVKLKVAA